MSPVLPDCSDFELYLLKHKKEASVRKNCYIGKPFPVSIRVGPDCKFSINHRYSLKEFSRCLKGKDTCVDEEYIPSQGVWLEMFPHLHKDDQIWTATSMNCGFSWEFLVVRNKRPLCFVFTDQMM